jgi:hypothetical protein
MYLCRAIDAGDDGTAPLFAVGKRLNSTSLTLYEVISGPGQSLRNTDDQDIATLSTRGRYQVAYLGLLHSKPQLHQRNLQAFRRPTSFTHTRR